MQPDVREDEFDSAGAKEGKCSCQFSGVKLNYETRLGGGAVPNHFSRLLRSPVAQLVEQVAVNHPVAGSSPAGGALLFLAKISV